MGFFYANDVDCREELNIKDSLKIDRYHTIIYFKLQPLNHPLSVYE